MLVTDWLAFRGSSSSESTTWEDVSTSRMSPAPMEKESASMSVPTIEVSTLA